VSTAPPFRYDGYRIDPTQGLLTCHYSLGEHRFAERVGFPGGGDWAAPAVAAAARLVFLLAGVSYYKTAAPSVIDLGDTAVTDAERAFLAGELAGLPELAPAADLLRPLSEHFIPDAYAADDLLV
jgi:UDP-N-acetyl-alpha-D-muramoyl-L-alanyl-L-glutamate epimerase